MERSESGDWTLATENNWSIDDTQLREIGQLIEQHRPGSEGFETGVYTK